MKGPVQLPDGRFAKVLWWDKRAQGWQIEVTSREGRGERSVYPTRMLKRVDPNRWREISKLRRAKTQTAVIPKMLPEPDSCPQCQTPAPSYQAGVPCPNCEFLEHSFKRWLEASEFQSQKSA